MQYITATLVEDTKKEGTPMESNVTVINATNEFLNAEIQKRDERIQQLEQHCQSVTQRDYNTRAELDRIKDQMKDWTLEALSNRDISDSNAEEIADICQFELVQEVEAEVSVTYYITVNVPAGESAEDIIDNIDFDAISYDMEAITNVSSSVNRVDI